MKKFIVITTIIAFICISVITIYTKINKVKYIEASKVNIAYNNDYEINRYAGITKILH